MRLSYFLVEQVHVVGCSTLLLTEVWRHLRHRCVIFPSYFPQEVQGSSTVRASRDTVSLAVVATGSGLQLSKRHPVGTGCV